MEMVIIGRAAVEPPASKHAFPTTIATNIVHDLGKGLTLRLIVAFLLSNLSVNMRWRNHNAYTIRVYEFACSIIN